MHDQHDHGISDRAAYALLLASWLLIALVTDPRAELPLNDDWAYSLPVQSWIEQGRLKLTFWQSMPLLPQLGWGALFCLPFGFSFTALRLSTLVLGGLGVCLTYRLLRDRGVSQSIALISAGCLLSQPVYVALAHTFMTDVPFVALLLASSLFLMHALDDDHRMPLLIGTVLALLATLVRQVGLVLPLAFAVAAIARWGWTRKAAARALLPLMLVAASLPLSRWWIARNFGLPALYDARDGGLTAALTDLAHLHLGVLRYPIERSTLLVLHLGISLLPLSCVLLLVRARTDRRLAFLSLGLGGLFALILGVIGFRFPNDAGGNVLLDFAVGPRNLEGARVLFPTAFRLLITSVAAFGAAALLVLIGSSLLQAVRQWRSGRPPVHVLFLMALFVIGFAPFAIAYGAHFDRYALFMVPLVPVLLLLDADLSVPLRALGPVVLWVIVTAGFSAMATHDLLAWNRAVWSLANEHTQHSTEQLDAGFEYNNYLQQHAELFDGAPVLNQLADRSKAPFAIAFTAPPGARVIARKSAGAWLPYAPTEVVLFAR